MHIPLHAHTARVRAELELVRLRADLLEVVKLTEGLHAVALERENGSGGATTSASSAPADGAYASGQFIDVGTGVPDPTPAFEVGSRCEALFNEKW